MHLQLGGGGEANPNQGLIEKGTPCVVLKKVFRQPLQIKVDVPCLIMHGALVAPCVALHGLDDDEQLIVGGEEVSLGRLQFAAVLGPREPRLGAARRHALDHGRVAQRNGLALHRFDEP